MTVLAHPGVPAVHLRLFLTPSKMCWSRRLLAAVDMQRLEKCREMGRKNGKKTTPLRGQGCGRCSNGCQSSSRAMGQEAGVPKLLPLPAAWSPSPGPSPSPAAALSSPKDEGPSSL